MIIEKDQFGDDKNFKNTMTFDESKEKMLPFLACQY